MWIKYLDKIKAQNVQETYDCGLSSLIVISNLCLTNLYVLMLWASSYITAMELFSRPQNKVAQTMDFFPHINMSYILGFWEMKTISHYSFLY